MPMYSLELPCSVVVGDNSVHISHLASKASAGALQLPVVGHEAQLLTRNPSLGIESNGRWVEAHSTLEQQQREEGWRDGSSTGGGARNLG